jgi:hypothetical protein
MEAKVEFFCYIKANAGIRRKNEKNRTLVTKRTRGIRGFDPRETLSTA